MSAAAAAAFGAALPTISSLTPAASSSPSIPSTVSSTDGSNLPSPTSANVAPAAAATATDDDNGEDEAADAAAEDVPPPPAAEVVPETYEEYLDAQIAPEDIYYLEVLN